jgi:hypothetical protein
MIQPITAYQITATGESGGAVDCAAWLDLQQHWHQDAGREGSAPRR